MSKEKDYQVIGNVGYAFILIFSAVSIIGIIVLAGLTLFDFKGLYSYLEYGPLIDPKNPIFWRMLGIIFLAILTKVLYSARIKIRHITDFNKHGRSKKFESYDKLSAAQKAKIDEQKLMDAERILDTNQLRKMTHKGSVDPEKDMEKLIGLKEVKQTMLEMAARMEYEQKHAKKKNAEVSMHMCFLGPPGTGKTTSARIMAGYLYKNKFIKKNKCIEVDGNFLKGVNPGETSTKVELIIEQALGGVLFIDEAYALLNGGFGAGEEAVATIVKSMEDNRGDLVIILAGYEKEMKELINSNPGIFSRIKYYMWFGNYTDEDLRTIFTSMANEQGFCVSAEALDRFSQKMHMEKKKKNFGNARTVRNTLEKAIDKHSYNIMKNVLKKDKMYMIEAVDIDMSSKAENIFNN